MPYHTTNEYPLLLLTGRGSSARWGTEPRTSQSASLQKLYPAGLVLELHPTDAKRLRISEGQAVAATAPAATIRATAHITTTVQPGTAFLAMHATTAHQLTAPAPALDPPSRLPGHMASPIAVLPAQYGS